MTDFAHGLVLGKFWPLHAGHSHLIEQALARCERVTVQVLGHPDEDIPLAVRERWVREIHPRATVVAAYDTTPVDFDDPSIWDLHMVVIRELLPTSHGPVSACFTSDEYGAELARRLDATWVQVDRGRVRNAVSGTAVRADPAAQWGLLDPRVRSWFVDRVVVTGAESTGTTTLSRALAERLGCAWVPEYGRQWSEVRPGGLATPWETAEFVRIARTQNALEEGAARASGVPVIVADTDTMATTLWHERYVGHRSAAVEAIAAQQVRPLARILTGDEIPWVQDGMRDGEHIRHAMQQRFREALAQTDVPWIEVRGSVEERIDRTVRFLATFPTSRFSTRGESDPRVRPARGWMGS